MQASDRKSFPAAPGSRAEGLQAFVNLRKRYQAPEPKDLDFWVTLVALLEPGVDKYKRVSRSSPPACLPFLIVV
jgi:hypothetical protein